MALPMTNSTPPASRRTVNPWAVLLTAGVLAVMAAVVLARIEVDSDILATLPRHDPVLAAARRVLLHHPLQQLVVVDIAHPGGDADLLAAAGDRLVAGLRASGLFAGVGAADMGAALPVLVHGVAQRLPVLFDDGELAAGVAPRLDPEALRRRLEADLARLQSLEGIGQAALVDADPLGLRELVLRRLAPLAPAPGIRYHRGHLLSPDGRHLLVMARPAGSATEAGRAAQLLALLDGLARELEARPAPGGGPSLSVTHMGAYRAALDNQTMAKGDVRRMLLWSTLGVAVLLYFAFPRPLVGLLALVPAAAGTLTALFLLVLFRPTVSILTLGFGGAIVAITVDHGIAYLLFMDRPQATRAAEAAGEVRAVGLLAALTTVGGFLALNLSGFPILGEIGTFAALGIAAAFTFVHTVFPRLIPELPPAARTRAMPLQRLADRVASAGGWGTAAGALALAGVLAFWGRPDFRVDLRAMNAMTPATRAAEAGLAATWGQLQNRIFLMLEADRLEDLMDRGDRLTAWLEGETRAGRLEPFFAPAMVYPGPARAAERFRAWRAFWREGREAGLEGALARAGRSLGLAPGAFASFRGQVGAPQAAWTPPPPELYELLGIAAGEGDRPWRLFLTLRAGPAYAAEAFHARLAERTGAAAFDPDYFARRLGERLARTFGRMLLVVGGGCALVLLVSLADVLLATLALLPVSLALVATLGVLGLLDRPVDIPGLMLAIVVFGMGIDYALFLIRAHQRYGGGTDAHLGLFRLTVMVAAGSTLAGFGALLAADHVVFRSAGLTTVLGIGFSLLGAFALLPPLLDRLFRARPGAAAAATPDAAARQVRARYRHREAGLRWRVGRELRRMTSGEAPPDLSPDHRVVMVYPTGCGVAAAWILARRPGVRILGADPDADNRRVSAQVLGAEAVVALGEAETLPPGPADAALVWDPLGRLDPEDLEAALAGTRDRLGPGGALTLVRGGGDARGPWMARIRSLGLETVDGGPSGGEAWRVTGRRAEGLGGQDVP
jgi:predicted exporter